MDNEQLTGVLGIIDFRHPSMYELCPYSDVPHDFKL
jgi:hypothetical protein